MFDCAIDYYKEECGLYCVKGNYIISLILSEYIKNSSSLANKILQMIEYTHKCW